MPASSNNRVKIKDAMFPKPFINGLEFNAPVHGTWNIVHIGFKIPKAHQIYVCADNCMRGVVMTAAEMGELKRFSSVVLEEDDMVHSGRLEESTIEGVTDILDSFEVRPPVVIVFPVCAHRFMGCDMQMIYKELGRRFPDVRFVRGFMDPVMQKRSTTPDQRLRKAMMDIIPELPSDGSVGLIGCDMKAGGDNDIAVLLKAKGITVRDEADCKSLDDYYSIGKSEKLICSYPAGLLGSQALSIRLGRELHYLPFVFDYDEIKSSLESVGLEAPADGIELCEKACNELKSLVGDTEIAIDYTAVPRPLSLALYLVSHGFNLKRIYLDVIDKAEEDVFEQLKKLAPDIELCATMHVLDRHAVNRAKSEGKVLAIGQKAAWFEGTDLFVNMIEGGGLYGFSGIRKFLELCADAYSNPKDTRDIVPRKGLGCCSII